MTAQKKAVPLALIFAAGLTKNDYSTDLVWQTVSLDALLTPALKLGDLISVGVHHVIECRQDAPATAKPM